MECVEFVLRNSYKKEKEILMPIGSVIFYSHITVNLSCERFCLALLLGLLDYYTITSRDWGGPNTLTLVQMF